MPELADRIPGEIILASYNNDQRDRLVQRYADATARSVSTPIPAIGDVSYLTSTGIFAIYDGVEWVDFIDFNGGQSIDGTLFVNGDLRFGDKANFTSPVKQLIQSLGRSRILLSYDPQGDGDTMRSEISWELGSGFSDPDPAANPDAALIVNSGDAVSTPRLRMRARSSTLHSLEPIQAQLAIISGALALDSSNPLRLSAPTSTVGNDVLFSTTDRDWTGQLSTDTMRELRFSSTSGEQVKDINPAAMTKAHGHHPVHLLEVEFKRWSYKPGYLEAGDPREGKEYLAPTAQTVDAAYPFAAEHDDGVPFNINQKILTEGLLWLVQDLSARVIALEG